MEDVLPPVIMCLMILGIVIAVQTAGTIRRENVLKTVRQAIQSGQTVTPSFVRALGVQSDTSKRKDLKAGSILIAIALAMVFFGYAMTLSIPEMAMDEDAPNLMMIFAGIGSFPGLIGLVLILFGLTRKDGETDQNLNDNA
ncbi:hypothetical protein [Woodsholea maritima]|uniref:hypothetical protein n=1 Tax=Woodsholea maritima TaxID=240237 RepID=UPI000360689E|nr:hypothetical protein [Woodsholea maritima]